ncbi:MAG: helicase [Clostridia bacterium]|nr:helicase [Clostridia bacterium]
MDRQKAQELYAQAAAKEREDYLYKRALTKVKPVTRDMSEAEKEKYLQSQGFQNTLYQLKRRDKTYQMLLRGELFSDYNQEEFESLAGLIMAEGKADLPFLRSVERSRVPLAKAHAALNLLHDHIPRKILEEKRGQYLTETEARVERFLKKGDLVSGLKSPQKAEHVAAYVLENRFQKGLSNNMIIDSYFPESLTTLLRQEITREHPELTACGGIITPNGEKVSTLIKAEVSNAQHSLCGEIRRRFPEKRIRRLITENPSLRRLQKQNDARMAKEQRLRTALLNAIPEHYRDLYPLARQMKRRFILHLGPTNSGKTYEGVQRLRGARHGIYLGPLRLLAAEQFETLNMDDVPCSLVTGEEQIRVPGSRVQSSTVEMADLNTHYDVAVIDECQMIADWDRGGAWTAAILGLCADEIHACASPDAEALLTRMITDCGDELSIVRHERMTPLEVEKEGFQFPGSVRPGDALIVFSKARVHAVAAELRSKGYRVSLIYGALPPDVRRDQAERFHQGETDVVVSTDAIAMGMNLPIERVVFLESEKYDGDITRTLTDAEIKQIAGRAGRYGIYDIGYVNAYGFKGLVASALSKPLRPLTEAVIRFPESLLGIPLPLTQIINQWMLMQDKGCFSKASTVRMATLAAMLETKHTNKELLYRFLCIPFDETEPDLLTRWKAMYHAESQGEHIEVLTQIPRLLNPEECTIWMLDALEADYRRCDLYYNYSRLFLEDPDIILDEIQRRKDLISQGIIHILSTQKLQQKVCHSCKKHLPWNWPYRLCDSCYRRHNSRGGRVFIPDYYNLND